MAQITSERLRKLLTKGAHMGLSQEQVISKLKAYGHTVSPDTVRKVREHYKIATPRAAAADSAQAAAPAGASAAAPTSQDDAAAAAVAAAAPPMEPASTPGQTAQSVLHAAGKALPGTLGVAGSLAAPALLPAAAGGAALGALGGVAPMLGAGVGGSAGEALNQLITGQPLDAGKIADEGGAQVGAMALGQGLAKGVSGAGKGMLTIFGKLAPEEAQTAIREGIAITKGGLKRLEAKIKLASQSAKAVTADATQRGIKHDLPNIVKEALKEVADEIEYGHDPVGQKKQLRKWAVQYLQRKDQQTPSAIHEMRIMADDSASPVRKAATQAAKMGQTPPGPVRLLRARFDKAIADAERRELNRIDFDPVTMTSPMHQANSYLSDLMKLREAVAPQVGKRGFMQKALERGLPATAGGTVAAALTPGDFQTRAGAFGLGAGVGAGLTSPQVASHLGLMANDPRLLTALLRFPQLAGIAASQF